VVHGGKQGSLRRFAAPGLIYRQPRSECRGGTAAIDPGSPAPTARTSPTALSNHQPSYKRAVGAPTEILYHEQEGATALAESHPPRQAPDETSHTHAHTRELGNQKEEQRQRSTGVVCSTRRSAHWYLDYGGRYCSSPAWTRV